MHHISAYNISFTAASVETEAAAIVDSYFTIQNNHLLPQRPVSILFAAALGVTLSKARINTPTLGVITSPFIMPMSPLLSMSSPMKFSDYSQDNLQLAALEEVQAFVTHTAAGAEQNMVLLGFDMGKMAQPPGNVYTIRGTAVATLTANVWTNLGTITWQNTLPSGVYAVVGAVFQSASGVAGRLILENTPYRPGCPAQLLVTDWTAELFRRGNLGQWGTFHNYAMPQVEMLATAGDVAETVFLDLVKIA